MTRPGPRTARACIDQRSFGARVRPLRVRLRSRALLLQRRLTDPERTAPVVVGLCDPDRRGWGVLALGLCAGVPQLAVDLKWTVILSVLMAATATVCAWRLWKATGSFSHRTIVAMGELSLVDLVGVGLNATDTLIPLAKFPERGSKVEYAEASILPGGQTASAVIACQTWGLTTRYVGKLGDDDASRLHCREFSRAGVDAESSRCQMPPAHTR